MKPNHAHLSTNFHLESHDHEACKRWHRLHMEVIENSIFFFKKYIDFKCLGELEETEGSGLKL